MTVLAWITILVIGFSPMAPVDAPTSKDTPTTLCGGGGNHGGGGDHHGDGDHHDGQESGATNGFKSRPVVGTTARCPVMRRNFKIARSSKYSVYKGRYYVFCCPSCKPKFDKNPSHYTHDGYH